LLYERKNYVGSIFFFIIAVWTHISFAVFIPSLFILTRFANNRPLSILTAITVLLTSSLLLPLFSHLIGFRADWYFQGGDSLSGKGFQEVTINGLFVMWIPLIAQIPLYIWMLRHKKYNTIWQKLFVGWTILSLALITNSEVMKRTTWGAQSVLVFALMDYDMSEIIHSIKRKAIQIGLIITLVNTVNYGHSYYINSRFEYLITPLPVALHNTYSLEWIEKHIENNNIIKERGPLFESN